MQQLICLASDSLICFGVIRTFHVRILLFLPDTLCCCILAVSMHSDIRSVLCGSVTYVYILTCLSPSVVAVFFLIHFSLPLFPPLLLVILFVSTWLQVPIQ